MTRGRGLQGYVCAGDRQDLESEGEHGGVSMGLWEPEEKQAHAVQDVPGCLG